MANKFPAVNKAEIKSVQVLTPRLQQLKQQWEEAEPQVYVDDTLTDAEAKSIGTKINMLDNVNRILDRVSVYLS